MAAGYALELSGLKGEILPLAFNGVEAAKLLKFARDGYPVSAATMLDILQYVVGVDDQLQRTVSDNQSADDAPARLTGNIKVGMRAFTAGMPLSELSECCDRLYQTAIEKTDLEMRVQGQATIIKYLKDGMREIAQMPLEDADRMRQWALDSLSGPSQDEGGGK